MGSQTVQVIRSTKVIYYQYIYVSEDDANRCLVVHFYDYYYLNWKRDGL